MTFSPYLHCLAAQKLQIDLNGRPFECRRDRNCNMKSLMTQKEKTKCKSKSKMTNCGCSAANSDTLSYCCCGRLKQLVFACLVQGVSSTTDVWSEKGFFDGGYSNNAKLTTRQKSISLFAIEQFITSTLLGGQIHGLWANLPYGEASPCKCTKLDMWCVCSTVWCSAV